jgi:PAS domain S-box-containing protein
MSKNLRVLIVEDSPDDAVLLVRELRRSGYDVISERVETREEMRAALTKQTWDLVLADFNMLDFNGIEALTLLKATGLDIPFIIISGSIGEDLAVAAMKAGAHDYLMKGKIARLIPSIERELRDAEIRDQRRRAEEALQYSEARKRAIVNAALDSIITVDHEGHIIEFNPAAEKTFGYNGRDVIGKPLTDFIIPLLSPDSHRDGLNRYMATCESQLLGKRIEMTAIRADGKEFPAELAITRISKAGPPMFSAYIRDLTEQKAQEDTRRRSQQLEEQNIRMQEANRLKSEFLANMSHELRTPLNAIIGFSTLMYDGKVGPVCDQHKEYLGDIISSSSHLLQLINDVLDLAKIEAGKMELNVETFSIKDVIDEVYAAMKPLASKRNITIHIEVSGDTELITLDQRKFKQVLYNLLSNAVKFSHDNGEVKIAALREQDQIRLRVEDFGIGIKSDDLPRLFGQFQQLDAGTDRRYQGTGLGLALTRKIIELQQGSITVESELGKGSTFIVTIPSAVANPVTKSRACADACSNCSNLFDHL